ncbi:MAG: tRNA epoxyqueuosine(34) reductase QueG [Candidatus Omnitrophota bacterium]
MLPAAPSGCLVSLASWIKACAKEMGFYSVGILPAKDLFEKDSSLEKWNRKGYSGTMSYLQKFDERQEHLKSRFPSAKSVIVLTVSYCRGGETPRRASGASGRVARYARCRDYHKVLEEKLQLLSQKIREHAGSGTFQIFVDSAPILEKKLASRSGLGFIGKNTTLVTPAGSYFFLSELVTDLELAYDASAGIVDGCRDCRLCIDVCPTGAIVEPYTIDARRCIAYLTIEHQGDVAEELQPKMDQWLFGCDLCIDACPRNSAPVETPWEELKERLVAPSIPLEEIFSLKDDASFRKKFEGTPLLRVKRGTLIRNAEIILKNLKEGEGHENRKR